MEALDQSLKIYENEVNWYLVLLIYGIPFCFIEGSHMPLVLVVDPCYHVIHISIILIMIQMHLRSIKLEEVFIKVTINLIILLESRLIF